MSSEHSVLGVVTQPDKPVGRHQELHASPVKELALRFHVPIFQPPKIREASAIAQIQFLRPDVIVVMAYGQILPRVILNIPTVACLNLHASLLPRHRARRPSRLPSRRAIARAESPSCTWPKGSIPATFSSSAASASAVARRAAACTSASRRSLPRALSEALLLLKQGRAPRIPQQEAEATHAPKLAREHGEIPWKESREVIDRKIRAMNPWPSAYTWLPTADGSRKLKVFGCIQSRRAQGRAGRSSARG